MLVEENVGMLLRSQAVLKTNVSVSRANVGGGKCWNVVFCTVPLCCVLNSKHKKKSNKINALLLNSFSGAKGSRSDCNRPDNDSIRRTTAVQNMECFLSQLA